MKKTVNDLNQAKRKKNDEFFTQRIDIDKELVNYKDFFNNKTVLCNCNDGSDSEFTKYFIENFNVLGLSKLFCSSYGSDAKVLVYDGKETSFINLGGDGDFRSDEMIEFLKKSDIVVTNAPFSLFREYISQLMDFNKKFIIMGNGNAVTYKEIFPMIKENKIWLGCTLFCGNMPYFRVSDKTDISFGHKHRYDKDGNILKQVNSIAWFTNIEHNKRHNLLKLDKIYNKDYYPVFDNHESINVNKTCNIPIDYDGLMAVPISFLDKFCPEQFEIIGIMTGTKGKYFINGNDGRAKFYLDGKGVYARIIIKRRK